MSEELADSGSESESFDMDAAQASVSEALFPSAPVVATEEGEEVQEGLAGKEPEEKAEAETEPETEKAEAETEPETKKEVRAAPQSWKKEMHEFWNGLDPAVQNYVEQREEQMREGLEKDRGDANLGRVMRDVMSPYSQMLRDQNIDEGVMVRNLMNAHYRLSTADDAGRIDLIKQIAQSYNVSLDGEAPQVDPALKAVQDKVNYLERNISQSQQRTIQEARDRVEKEVDTFASDPEHAFFDEVSEQIVPLINAGYSLQEAYENAIWLNPVTRQKEIDRTAKEASEKSLEEAKQEAEKKRKAKGPNVRGRDTSKAPTEPTGTMEDTMREAYREIQNRSH